MEIYDLAQSVKLFLRQRLAGCGMSVRSQLPGLFPADRFYLALERYVTHHAGERDYPTCGESGVTLTAVVLSVPKQVRFRIRRRPSDEWHCVYCRSEPLPSYHFLPFFRVIRS